MAPQSSKTSFKSYEVQARLLRAIVAAHQEVKWNYKDIARYFGESTTDGIQYQFRSIKRDATAMRTAVDINESPIAAIADSLVATSGNGSSSGARRRVPKAAGKAKLEAPNIKRDEASDGDEITKRDRDGESDGNDEGRLGPLVTSSWLPLKRKRTGDTGVAGEVGFEEPPPNEQLQQANGSGEHIEPQNQRVTSRSRAPAIDLVDYT
ncbi:hypothetical protein CFO_g3476 [Ceratocystis platani]|uniref:Myb-like domain-containing protein n=1 Tax=Ceratocystis fimbriata f. sp. platani TaxID=88771 RepID=A0A0F8BNT3_CERFI|nr:hypothetical protein CFO_g3476 [Ceratocystis platani]